MTTTITSANSSTTSQLLLAADGTRTSVTLQNTDANTLYVALGQAATTAIGGYTFSRNYGASATLTPLGLAFNSANIRHLPGGFLRDRTSWQP